jgi:hypothetical protein
MVDEIAGKPEISPERELSLDHHVAGKPAAMVDLFEQIDEFGSQPGSGYLPPNTQAVCRLFHWKRSFFTVEIQRQRLIVYLGLDPSAVSHWNEKAMRDVRKIGTSVWATPSFASRSVAARRSQRLDQTGPRSEDESRRLTKAI